MLKKTASIVSKASHGAKKLRETKDALLRELHAQRKGHSLEVLEGRIAPAAIKVAVVGSTLGTQDGFHQTVAQLNNDTYFDFTASYVAPSQIDSVAELNAYDVVVIGDHGTLTSGSQFVGNDFETFAPALRTWVEAGGGVVATGWTVFGAGSYGGAAPAADIDAIIPVNTSGTPQQNSDFTVTGAVHPITNGVTSFVANTVYIEYPVSAPTVDAGATVLGTTNGSASAVAGRPGAGKSVYLGLAYATPDASWGGTFARGGEADQLLEQAVAWAAGDEYERAIMDLNPVAYYRLDETSGTLADDSSPNANDGTYINGPLLGQPGEIAGNTAVSFDGANDYVSVPRSISGTFTISAWIKTTQANAGGSQWYHGHGLVDGEVGGVTADFGTSILNGKFAFGVGQTDTTIQSTTSVNDGNWHFVVATRDATTGVMKVYVDGVEEASAIGPVGAKTAPGQITIGRLQTAATHYSGVIDEVALFGSQLSSTQIGSLYATAIPPVLGSTTVDLSGGNLIITDSDGGTSADRLTLTLNGTNVRVVDPTNLLTAGSGATQIDGNTVEIPLGSITGGITVHTLGGDDILTIDLSSGDFIPASGLSFNGGAGGFDSLVITGGAQGSVTYNYTNANDGSVGMSNFGTITYTGLEPIANGGTATDIIFNLPAGLDQVVLEDDGGGTGNSLLQLRSANGSFETTVFSNPSGSVTINTGGGADTLVVNAVSDLTAAVTLGLAGTPFSVATLNANISGAVSGAATLVNVNAPATIQDGVNVAVSGGTVNVGAGTFGEMVTVNKPIDLLGAQAGVDARTRNAVPETVVTGNAGSTSFYVTANGVTIDGFTVQGQTNVNLFGAGIVLGAATSGAHVLNNIIQNNVVGLFLSNHSAVTPAVVEQNLFRDNTNPGAGGGHDIYADQFTGGAGLQNVQIVNNTFTNTSLVAGSWALGISNTGGTAFEDITFSGNTVTNHGRGAYFYGTDGATITGNTFDGATNYGVGVFGWNGVLPNQNFTITGNTFEDSLRGIYLSDDSAAPAHTGAPIVVSPNTFINTTTPIDFEMYGGQSIGAIDFGSANVTITGDDLDFTGGPGSILGTGILTIVPLTAGGSIGLNGAPGNLTLSNADLLALGSGFSQIVIGETGAGHDIVYDANLAFTFSSAVVLNADGAGGSIAVLDSNPGNGVGALRSAAQVLFNGTGTTTTLSANMVTTGAPITINDSVLLAAAVTLDTTDGGAVPAGAAISITGNIDLAANTLTWNAGATATSINTQISGIGGGLTKLGAGTLTLTQNNSYTGTTTVNAGTLRAGVASVANVSGAFGNNSAVVLGNTAGAILDLAGFNTQIGSLTGGGAAGGNVTLGAATLTIGGDNTSPAGYAGVISGGGGVTKIGTGTLTLTGANTYDGNTLVNAGVLNIRNDTALGSTAGGTTVASGAALQLQNGITVTGEALTINGNGNGGNDGALRNVSGNNAWTGNITANPAAPTFARIFSDTGNLAISGNIALTGGAGDSLVLGGNGTGTVSGVISGLGGVIKSSNGTGTWTLSGNNTYGGTTAVSSGTLQIGAGGTSGTLGGGGATTAAGTTLAFNRSDSFSVPNTISGGGTLRVSDSGGINFTSTVSAATVQLLDTTGTITFSNSLTATTLTTANQGYSVAFNGTTNVANAVTFLNTGTVSLGNGGDSLSFAGGLTTSGNASNPSLTQLGGSVSSTNALIRFGALALTSASSVSAGSGAVTFSGTVSGAFSLNVPNGSGDVTFTGAVGNPTPLTTLTVTGNNVTAAAVSTTGAVSLTAQNALTLNGALNAGASTIALLANQDGLGAQGFIQNAGATITTTNNTAGAVAVSVGGSGTASIRSINAGTTSGGITITASSGAITDGDGGAAVNLNAAGATLTAGTGIGSAVNPIETSVAGISASTSTGGIYLANTGALNIAGAGASTSGDLVLTATGAITTTGAVSTGSGAISIEAGNSALTIGANVTATGDITLGAEGVNDSPTFAQDFTLNAGATVQTSTGNVLIRAGDDILLAAGSTVTATTGTVTFQTEYGDTDGGGTVSILGTINSGGAFSLSAPGDIVVGLINAPGQTVTLTADSDNNGTGAIFRDGVTATNVIAGTLNVSGAQRIAAAPDAGTFAISLVTQVSALSATVNAATAAPADADILISNSGALTVNDARVLGGVGGITITTASPLTIAANVSSPGPVVFSAGEISDSPAFADDLTVNAGVSVVSTGSSVTLSAGDDIILLGGVAPQVSASTTASLTAASGDLDNGGGINLGGAVQAGGTVTLTARDTISLGANVTSTGGNIVINSTNNDVIRTAGALTATSGTIALTAGGADGDIANIQLNTTAVTFTGTGTGDVTITDLGAAATNTDISGTTGSGNIVVRALNGNLTVVGAISTTNYAELQVDNGSLFRSGAGSIVSANIALFKVNDFGTGSGSLGTAGSPMLTDVNSFQYRASQTGSVWIVEDDGLTSLSGDAGPGANGEVHITSNTGNIVDALINHAGMDLFLTATAGEITESGGGDAATEIIADQLTLVAGTFIRGNNPTRSLDVNVNQIVSATAGSGIRIDLRNNAELTQGSANHNTTVSAANVTGAGAIVFEGTQGTGTRIFNNLTTAAGGITIDTTAGNIQLGGGTINAGGLLSITANGNGNITQVGAGIANGTQIDFATNGGSGNIGALGAPIQINTATLFQFAAAGTGNVFINEQNTARFGGTSGSGNIVLTSSAGNLTIEGHTSTSGDVTVIAAGSVLRNGGAAFGFPTAIDDLTLTALNGTIGTIAAPILTTTSTLTTNSSAANGDQFVTESNGLTNVLMNAGTGDITLVVNAGNVANPDAGVVDITANDFIVTLNGAGATVNLDLAVDTLAATTQNGNQTFTETNGIALNLLSAGTGTVLVTAAAGAITDNNAGAQNVLASNLALIAPAGVGTSVDPIDTTVGTFASQVSSGGVYIAETNALTIGAVGAATGISAAAANVTITSGDLTIAENVTTTGVVNFASTGSIVETTGAVQSASLLTTTSAGGQTLLGANTVASFNATNSGSGNIDLNNTAATLAIVQIGNPAGNTTVTNAGNVQLGTALNQNVNVTGIARITATGGAITDGQAVAPNDGVNNITALATILTAGSAVGTLANPIETDVTFLEGSAGAGFFITEANALTIGGITPADDGIVAGGNIAIISGALSITERVVTPGNVTLNAAGSIVESAAGRISAANLNANSNGGQVLNGANTVGNYTATNLGAGTGISLENDFDGFVISSVTSQTGGNIFINNAGDNAVISGQIRSGNPVLGGDITVITNGVLTVNATVDSRNGSGGTLTISNLVVLNTSPIVGFGNVTLQGGAGTLTINAPITVSSPLILTATEDVNILAKVETSSVLADLTVLADSDSDGDGGVYLGAGPGTNQGQLKAGRNLDVRGSEYMGSAVPGLAFLDNSIIITSNGANARLEAVGNVLVKNNNAAPFDAKIWLGGLVRSNTNGDVAFDNAVLVTSNDARVHSHSDGDVIFLGTVDSAVFGDTLNLRVNSGTGVVLFNAAVGQVSPLGDVTVEAALDVTVTSAFSARSLTVVDATGTVEFGGPVITTGAGTNLSVNAVDLVVNGTVNATAAGGALGSIFLQVNNIAVAGTMTGDGTLTIQPREVSRSIGVNETGDLNLSDSELDLLQGNTALEGGFSEIRIGRPDGNGLISIGTRAGGDFWEDPVVFRSPAAGGQIMLVGQQVGADNGAFTFLAPDMMVNVAPAPTITTISGAVQIGSFALNTATTLGSDLSIQSASGAVTIVGTINGAFDLSIDAGTGAVYINGNTTAVPTGTSIGGTDALSSIDISGGLLTLRPNMRTLGAQTYTGTEIHLLGGDFRTFNDGGAAVTFDGPVVLEHTITVHTTNSDIAFLGTVNNVALHTSAAGRGALRLTADAGEVLFAGDVGTVFAPKTVEIVSAALVEIGTSIVPVTFRGGVTVSITTEELDMFGDVAVPGGVLSIANLLHDQAIVVGGVEGTGALDISNDDVNALGDGTASILIGRRSGSGTADLLITGTPTFNDPVVFQQPTKLSGAILMSADLIGAGNGGFTFNSPATRLDGTLTTAGGSVDIENAVASGALSTITTADGAVTFRGTLMGLLGGEDITVDAGTGTIHLNTLRTSVAGTLMGTLTLDSGGLTRIERGLTVGALVVEGGGIVNLKGTITTTEAGGQTYDNAVHLIGSANLTSVHPAGAISFGNTVDSNPAQPTKQYNLNIKNRSVGASGTLVQFDGAIGQTQALGNLKVNTTGDVSFGAGADVAAKGVSIRGGALTVQNVVTTGAQVYNGAGTFQGIITASKLNVTSTVDITNAGGAWNVAGRATLTAKNADISVTGGGNTFGELQLRGIDAEIEEAGDMVIRSTSLKGVLDVTTTAGGDISTGAARISAVRLEADAAGSLNFLRNDSRITELGSIHAVDDISLILRGGRYVLIDGPITADTGDILLVANPLGQVGSFRTGGNVVNISAGGRWVVFSNYAEYPADGTDLVAQLGPDTVIGGEYYPYAVPGTGNIFVYRHLHA